MGPRASGALRSRQPHHLDIRKFRMSLFCIRIHWNILTSSPGYHCPLTVHQRATASPPFGLPVLALSLNRHKTT